VVAAKTEATIVAYDEPLCSTGEYRVCSQKPLELALVARLICTRQEIRQLEKAQVSGETAENTQ